MKKFLIVLLLSCCAFGTSVQDQIIDLLQTGTKASDAIETVFSLLGDLKQSNIEAQHGADVKNQTDEQVGQATVERLTQVMKLNKKLFVQAEQNRLFYEQELSETKNYIAWNELRQDDIQQKINTLQENQCYSNQLFVRSIKMNADALETVRLLRQDVAGYVINGQSLDFVEVSKELSTLGQRLKKFSSLINDHEVNVFLQLAINAQNKNKNPDTVAEQTLQILDNLTNKIQESLENLSQNEINSAWQLAAWLQSSQAEIEWLEGEREKKQVYADRLATQIQGALAQQSKSNIILKDSENTLNQSIKELEQKRNDYMIEKEKRDEENAILDEIISMFKKQVASWSGRN